MSVSKLVTHKAYPNPLPDCSIVEYIQPLTVRKKAGFQCPLFYIEISNQLLSYFIGNLQ